MTRRNVLFGNRKSEIIGYGAVVILSALSYALLDRRVALLCATIPSSWSGVLDALTDLGDSVWYLVGGPILMLLWRFVWKKPHLLSAAALMFASVATSGLATIVIKPLLGRNRPVHLFDHDFFGFTPITFGYGSNSMPSGHAGTITAVTVSLALAFPRFRIPLYGLAALVASTRVLMNHHYASDVLLGAALSVFIVRGLTPWVLRRTWGQNWTDGTWEMWRRKSLPGYVRSVDRQS